MAEKVKNPLLEKVKGKIRDWNEWLELWGKASKKEEFFGLLDAGFQTYEGGAHAGNVCFYLEAANGYKYASNFSLPDEPRDERLIEMRREVAQEAFKMLCQHFFTDTSRDESLYRPSWAPLVLAQEVFEKLLWFFEPYDGLRSDNNLPPFKPENHEDEVAKTFLRDFLTFAWPIGRQPRERSAKTAQMFLNARPRMLEIMEGMRWLDLLIRKSRHDYLVEVDDVSMKKLEELALVKERRDDRVEKYPSLDAAVLNGSQTAQVLVLLRIIQKEKKRQEEVREAERQLKEVKRRLNELGSPVP